MRQQAQGLRRSYRHGRCMGRWHKSGSSGDAPCRPISAAPSRLGCVKVRRASWLRYKKSVCAGSFISKTIMTLRELRPCRDQAKLVSSVGRAGLASGWPD